MNHIEKRGASIDSGGEMKGRQPPADFELIETGEIKTIPWSVHIHWTDAKKREGGKGKKKRDLCFLTLHGARLGSCCKTSIKSACNHS
jgi:hypothetical protein